MDVNEGKVLRNIAEIRSKQRLTMDYMASQLDVSIATYSRLESGSTALGYKELAEIAKCFQMSVIDIITYPNVYVNKSDVDTPERVSITFEVSADKRDYLLKLVTGEK